MGTIRNNKTQDKVSTGGAKSIFGELKKVTWPKFGEVVKKTLIVLSIVSLFLVFIWGFNFGLEQLYKLIVGI